MSRVLTHLQLVVAVVAIVAWAGCGSEIGDSCSIGTDCSPDGDRVCDVASTGGYCTILGCDFDSCPSEATCVRFFSGTFSNRTCDRGASTSGCSLDEVCTLEGYCAPSGNEVHYCMKKCSSNSDCRDGYECRDLTLMREHGGEPVLAPGSTATLPKFCAQAPQ